MNDKTRNLIIWITVIVFAVYKVLYPWGCDNRLVQALIPAVSALGPTLFVLLHGSRQMGWRRILVFIVVTFLISWSYETLSIATGFPFGHYHYSDNIGPKLGTVPLLVMPAYFGVIYLSWQLARLLLQRFDQRIDAIQTWATPAVAAFIMVMWDVGMDPVLSTYGGSWVWHRGGSYFGVPISNFFGWYLCVWTILQVFALCLRRLPVQGVSGTPEDRRENWLQVIVMYAGVALGIIALAIHPPHGNVTDCGDFTWVVEDLYRTTGLTCFFTMGFVVVVSSIILGNTRLGETSE